MMPTRPASNEDERLRAYRARLSRPAIISIDGAISYWLESPTGRVLSPTSETSAAPLAAVLAACEDGTRSEEIVLVCGFADGHRYQIGSGGGLYDAALAAAGLPRVQHAPTHRRASA